MAHFCGFIKLIFLLLMLQRMLESSETRPLEGRTAAASSDLIAGNEFLKLFMEREELENEYYNKRQSSGGGGGSAGDGVTESFKNSEEFDKKSAETGKSRQQASRSLKVKTAKVNQAEGQPEDSKQVGNFQNSGSKVLYLDEDYEENDAILDAEARDIDLKRETYKHKDEYKVLISDTSSASQRGTNNRHITTTSRYDNKSFTSTKSIVTMTPRPPTATTTNKPSSSTSTKSNIVATLTGDNFINRSHKSEEVEPSTAKQQQQQHLQQQQTRQQQQQQRQQRRKTQQQKSRKSYTRHRSTYPITSVADTLEALDSENSASTNIQNVLASPLQPAASLRSMSTVTTTYHSGQRNVSINHDTSNQQHKTTDENDKNLETQAATDVDDQLLPFQTVIYHDIKDGHGPQSRSISYSSISQNVEDLKKWHQSGILAEARRNVSESLKLPHSLQSEPSNFYSQPSKMYSEPSKFYSEPAKVYSEPAKVYGEPEKIYSEPSKVYGQPSKIYSEPSKIYSLPSKVYSEPAKTYWPVTLTTSTTTTTTSRPTTFAPTTNPPLITTTNAPIAYQVSRKPAIVSRIAFGEAASITTTSSTTTPSTTTTASTTTTTAKPFSSYHHRTYGHRQPSTGSSSFSSASSADRINENTSSATPSRRILFNLDRLPYDLLNAPQPATQQQQQQHLLDLQNPQRSQQQQQQTFTYQQQLPQQQQQQHQQHHVLQPQSQSQQQLHHNINPCLESAVSSLFSSSTLSAHPALIKQRQQHSSLSDQQHSNQNAKGLPNGDLVRCVAGIPATVSSNDGTVDDGIAVQFTTERSNVDELFTPTPEQNYEIEESVSVMTNGRAHSIHGGGGGGGSVAGRNSLQLATTTLIPPPLAPQVFRPNRQRVHFGTNIDGDAGDTVTGGHLSHSSSYNTNANANRNLHDSSGNTGPDYGGDYDDGGDNEDNSNHNNNNDDYTDDDTGRHRGGGSGATNTGDGGDDDSKVAYVVEGRNYRKYRVEEKTDDGFIVGEYGVVNHNDGNLRGVRYTADSTINRSLIQKALLTFLKLK